MDSTKIDFEAHRCQFVENGLGGITSLTANKNLNKVKKALLACSREDGSIEIYSIGDKPVLERRIPGVRDHPIRNMCFVGTSKELRLLACTLTGLIVEYDLKGLKVRRYLNVNGGGIWCLKLSPNNEILALGCEDGSIRFIDLKDDQFEVVKVIEGRLNRILSLDWSVDGNHVLSGNDEGIIEKWNIKTGHSQWTLKVEKFDKKRSTIIWTLIHLRGDVFASGDSLGNVTLIDGEFGTKLNTFHCHESDILALAKAKTGDEFYSAGVDNRIHKFILNQSDNKLDWKIQGVRRQHTHDTVCLEVVKTKDRKFLFSGGLDMKLSYISLKEFNEGVYHQLPAYLLPSPIKVSETGLVAAQFDDHVKLYLLGSTGKGLNESSISFRECLTYFTQSSQNLMHSNISPDGRYLLLSDMNTTKLMEISISTGEYQLKSVSNFPPKDYIKLIKSKPKAFQTSIFLPDSRIIASNLKGDIYCFDLANSSFKEIYSSKEIPIVCQIIYHENRGYIGLISQDKVYILNINNQELVRSFSFDSIPSSISFYKDELVISCVNWELFKISLSDFEMSQINLPDLRKRQLLVPPSLRIVPDNDAIVAFNDSVMVALSLADNSSTLAKVHLFEDLAALQFIKNNRMVMFQMPYHNLASKLPPAFVSKSYTGDGRKEKKIKTN